jgi:hypothetical protein
MRPWILGAASAAAVVFFFPSDIPLSQKWSTASNEVGHVRTDSVLPAAASTAPDTSFPESAPESRVADPFGLPPVPVSTNPVSIGPAQPLPPRPWMATGRVGQRAAVLTATDGRILVVSDGSRVDSAVVVSIGSDGVVLEDRGGRFVLRIP